MSRAVKIMAVMALMLTASVGVALAATIQCDGGTCNGTNRNDTITGTEFVDTINGRAGDDVIRASTSNDTVNGNNGSDTINGGGGNDTLEGDAGPDTITDAKGNDSDFLGGGFQTVNNDTLDARDGDTNDEIDGDAGDDICFVDSISGQGTDEVNNCEDVRFN